MDKQIYDKIEADRRFPIQLTIINNITNVNHGSRSKIWPCEFTTVQVRVPESPERQVKLSFEADHLL